MDIHFSVSYLYPEVFWGESYVACPVELVIFGFSGYNQTAYQRKAQYSSGLVALSCILVTQGGFLES